MNHHIISIFFSLLAFLWPSHLMASDLFTYQGKLTNAQDQALPDGQYRIGVRIWENAAPPQENPQNEVPLWARKYDVPVQKGVFSLMIGTPGEAWGIVGESGGPMTASLKLALSSGNRHLDITVMSDANGSEKPEEQWQTLQPRQALNAVPYAMNGVPTGTVVPFAGTSAPEGWVLCDGSTLNGADPRFAPLFAAIQTAYGAGSGSQFKIPDLRGRTPIGTGKGDTWSPGGSDQSTNWVLGQKFGAERHQLSVAEMPQHNHNVRDTGHSHSTAMRYGGWGSTDGFRGWYGTYGGQVATTTSSANIAQDNRGSDQPHNNMQPSLVLNYIIKL